MKRLPPAVWSPLHPQQGRTTYAALHIWTQVVGKIHLALAPQANHWWNVPLCLTRLTHP